MSNNTRDPRKKQVIGLLGEMNVAKVLHEKEWQVYRPILDENIDFVLTRYYCKNCKKFTSLRKHHKAITNRCKTCNKAKVHNIVRFIQVKTSEGVRSGKNVDKFSFHAKLRHHVDPRTFYVWIAVHPGEQGERIDKKRLCYYVFRYKDVEKFDNIKLPSYQKTDNQKTTLRIDSECVVKNKGRKHNYDCFRKFLDNFEILDKITSNDK